MNFLGQTVIIIAMALIAVSLSGVSYILFKVELGTVVMLAAGLFALQVIFQLASWRVRDRVKTARDMNDLGRALESVTRDISVLTVKMNKLEQSGVLRSMQDVAVLRGALETVHTQMEQMGATLQQHHEVISSSRPFGGMAHAQSPSPNVAYQSTQEMGAPAKRDTARWGPLGHLDALSAADVVRKVVDQGRIEIMLQPIVTLPQRKIRWYEILSRMRLETGETLLPEDFLPVMASGDLALTFDTLVLYRAVQLVRRMQTRNKEIGVVVNLCGASLSGGAPFEQLIDFLSANSALNDSLVLEISQNAYNSLGALEFESLAAIAKLGFRFSLDQTRDLRLDGKALADRGFKTVKIPGEVLLGRIAGGSGDIHPADLSDMLNRYGIALVADKIEAESTVIDLLDYDIAYAQGFLFAPPRPVKADVLDDLPLGDATKTSLSA